MKHLYLWILLLLVSSIKLNAQSVSKKRSVFSNGGQSKTVVFEGNTYFIQQSIGQDGISGIGIGKSTSINQGFIQPYFINRNQLTETEKLNISISKINYSNTYSIKVNDEDVDVIFISLYDVLGRNVKSDKEYSTDFDIDLNGLLSGYYILHLYSNNNRSVSAKLLKN